MKDHGNTKSFTIDVPTTVLDYLRQLQPERSRSSIKQWVLSGAIFVDGKPCLRATQMLQAGQSLSIGQAAAQRRPTAQTSGLKILFEDPWLLVVDKPTGLLTISTDKDKVNTAYSHLRHYVKQQSAANKLFVVHRLDRDTSGVLVFARQVAIRDWLQTHWHSDRHLREYYALVSGQTAQTEGTVQSWLKEGNNLQMYSSQRQGDGQFSITHWYLMRYYQGLSLLRVLPETGRRNQIRVHLSDIGHPIVGDVRYGNGTNPIGRLGLHAAVLGFEHPHTHEMLRFESPMPKLFAQAVPPPL